MRSRQWFGALLAVSLSLAPPAQGQTPVRWAGEDEVFYQIFVRSFRDSNSDRIGDLKGIQDQLSYLQDLGVTSLLLTPVNPSPFYHNYFGSSFEGADPAFGGDRALANLIRAVHARKMKIYLDEEVQYVTGDHRWWKDSEGNPASKYSKFVLYNGPGNTQPETGVFGLSIVPMYNGTRVQIATVNLPDPAVVAYFSKLFGDLVDPNHDGRFEDGVDGFRLDHMMDDLDNKQKVTDLFARFWAPVIRQAKSVNPRIKFIAEQWDWGYGDDFLNRGGVDMVFAFPLRSAIVSLDAKAIAGAIEETNRRTAEWKGQLVFIENHDLNRFATEMNGDLRKERIGAALAILLKGTPQLYYGQELGMKGRQCKTWGTDANDIPVREAFEWSRKETAAGQATWYQGTDEWWTHRFVKDDDGISVEEQSVNPNSLFRFYRRMFILRRGRAELIGGSQERVDLGVPGVLAVFRAAPGSRGLLLYNLSDSAVTVDLTKASARLPGSLRVLDLVSPTLTPLPVKDNLVRLEAFGIGLAGSTGQ